MAKHLIGLRPGAATAGLGLVVCLFLANAWIAEYNTRRLKANDSQLIEVHTVLTTLEEVLAAVTEAEARERGFIITNDETYLKPFDAAASRPTTTPTCRRCPRCATIACRR